MKNEAKLGANAVPTEKAKNNAALATSTYSYRVSLLHTLHYLTAVEWLAQMGLA